MDVVHERAAGIDVSKRDAKVAVRVPGKRAGSYTTTVKTFGATASQILALIDYLVGLHVTTVVMEATSDYWKPFYYVMEDALPVMLVNAKGCSSLEGICTLRGKGNVPVWRQSGVTVRPLDDLPRR